MTKYPRRPHLDKCSTEVHFGLALDDSGIGGSSMSSGGASSSYNRSRCFMIRSRSLFLGSMPRTASRIACRNTRVQCVLTTSRPEAAASHLAWFLLYEILERRLLEIPRPPGRSGHASAESDVRESGQKTEKMAEDAPAVFAVELLLPLLPRDLRRRMRHCRSRRSDAEIASGRRDRTAISLQLITMTESPVITDGS